MPHRHPIFVLTVAVLIGLCFGTTPSAAQPPDVIGQWSLVAPLPYFPVHTHLLPTGKVMIWPGDGGVSGNDPRSWDPANGSVASLSKPGYDLFCSGHSFLADGTLFVAGGHISTFEGLSRASTYNPFTNTWNTALPDMNAGRWYPTTTVLANGDVLTIAGDIDTSVGHNLLPQVFQVSTGTWRDLTSAQLDLEDYPRMLLAPNGKVFNAAASTTTRYLDTSGTGAWSFVANRVGGYRDYGSAVMYAPGKVLVMGGGQDPPAKTAEVIDLNAASPTWRSVGSMQFARRHLNATLLPDGTVLVTGGYSGPGFGFFDTSPSTAVHAAELWDPATETWSTMARASIPRVYHSAALLLPDGRVLSTGGNGHPETETYSPPYLFKGPRPTITSAPSSVAYGQSFFVETPDASTTSKITMLRLSSVTHAFNQSQYINQLSFSQCTGGLGVAAPPSGKVAPPGYYLLFLLNGSGVPSFAKIIQVHDAPPPPTVDPSCLPDGLPDVIVTSLSYASGVFTSTVTNQGTAATPAGIAIGVGYSVDGVFRTFSAINGPLAAGASVTLGTDGVHFTIPSGTHTITTFVDDVNRFAESDETNNQLSQSITIGGTDTLAPPTCRGRVANIWVSNNTIFGGPDSGRPYTGTLRSTNDNDVIVGTGANDSINGAGGNDIMCGGAGRNTLRGGQGNDRLFGESGNDRLFGGPGRDLCNGGKGRDKVSGCERLK